MINIKLQQLADEFMQAVKEKFPEVELLKVIESPGDSTDLWMHVTAPAPEEREFELREFASEKSADILDDYGYLILIMPRSKNAASMEAVA